jgi:hydroxylamine oxidation protein HaoB
MTVTRKNWLSLAGVFCIVSGLGIAWFGLPASPLPELNWQKMQTSKPGEAGFPSLAGHYPLEEVSKYQVQQGETVTFSLDSVQYRHSDGELHQALLYLPDTSAPPDTPAITSKTLRHDLWQAASAAILEHSQENSLFLSWWDNAQRIDFFTGRASWASAPLAAAYPHKHEQALWKQVAGPFGQEEAPLRQLASWLTMDTEQALLDMASKLQTDRSVYLLVCLDDLARVSELETLSGKKLGFEARLFAPSTDIHNQINEVKRWAGETGTGSYLVQNLPGQGVRAWRILDSETENSLFAKLLPFTSSLAHPVAKLELVYQSGWGAYLSIFHWLGE